MFWRGKQNWLHFGTDPDLGPKRGSGEVHMTVLNVETPSPTLKHTVVSKSSITYRGP